MKNSRYDKMTFRRCGRSGLDLPAVSLGLWHNFGPERRGGEATAVIAAAFDAGITHFDLANNYGPPPGSAEETFGEVFARDFAAHRGDVIISTKAGYRMQPGPYGDGGSRKYLLSSLDASLRRLRLDYVDIFYHHRPDSSTPLEETAAALSSTVSQGKALYVGISNYDPGRTSAIAALLRSAGTPCLIHQMRYSQLDRRPEQGLFDALSREGIGSIAFSPLEQGLLAGRYLNGIPDDSRAGTAGTFLKPEQVTAERVEKSRVLAGIAAARGQTPAQLALAWVLRAGVTSVLIGASTPHQVAECAACLEAPALTTDELAAIDRACGYAS